MRSLILLSLSCCAAWGSPTHAGAAFAPLATDGIHDPTSPANGVLQEPVEALGNLPTDRNGNPDWVTSLREGNIDPRMKLDGSGRMKVVDLDIEMKNTASMPHVSFSHQVHTEWLTCNNCHSRIFLPQVGGNLVTMAKILEGRYCGVCHGSVAFTPLECDRCHSVPTADKGLR